MNDAMNTHEHSTPAALAEQKRKLDAYQELLWASERRKREASFARTRRRAAEESARKKAGV